MQGDNEDRCNLAYRMYAEVFGNRKKSFCQIFCCSVLFQPVCSCRSRYRWGLSNPVRYLNTCQGLWVLFTNKSIHFLIESDHCKISGYPLARLYCTKGCVYKKENWHDCEIVVEMRKGYLWSIGKLHHSWNTMISARSWSFRQLQFEFMKWLVAYQ